MSKKSASKPLASVAQLQAIESAIRSQRHEQAARDLNTLQKAYPHDARIYLLGSLLAEHNRQADAMYMAAWRAHELQPQWYVATFRVAEALHFGGKPLEAYKAAMLALHQAQHTHAEVRASLLQKLADMCIGSGMLSQALEHVQQLIALQPANAFAHLQRAQLLAQTGQTQAAIDAFGQAIALQADLIEARIGRLQCARATGNEALVAAEVEYLSQHVPQAEIAEFFSLIQRQARPSGLPAAMVAQLFDSYASHFNQHLIHALKYRLPELAAQRIRQWFPDGKLNLLDLGCGTGLLGRCLGPIEGAIVGVDLSAQMLEQALRSGVYDRLHHANLNDALRDTPSDLYQVIAALDVLNYIGDVTHIMPAMHRILAPGGKAIASFEALSKGRQNFSFDPATMRFAHAKRHIESLAEKSGFVHIQVEDIVIREHEDGPVHGFLLTAEKPA